MHKNARCLLVIMTGTIFMLLANWGISLANLRDPGLDEKAIKHAWKEFSGKKKSAKIKGNYPYLECFQNSAKKHNVPLPFLLAVARGESYFNPKAKSDKDCYGIMQIKWPGTAKDLGITKKSDLFDPCINIDAGARYLSWLLEKFGGDYYLATAGYFYGPNAVSHQRVPEKATWYAAYIHRHLQSVLSGPFKNTGRLLILEFTFYRGAEALAAYIEKEVEGFPLEIFKSRRYTYGVYYHYRTAKERDSYLHTLVQKTGINPKK